MAFLFSHAEGFESGGRGSFDSETDTASKLDFPHFTELARAGMAPYQGAYAIRIVNSGTDDAYVEETGGFDTAAAGTIAVRFQFYLGKNFTMADTDKVTLFTALGAGTSEVSCGIDRSGAYIRAWFAETAASTARTLNLGTIADYSADGRGCLNKWYTFELLALIDSGVPNDGTIDGWIDGGSIGAQITALDQGAITDARFGVIGPDAGTTGTILLDNIVADDARIGPDPFRARVSNAWIYLTEDHPIIGPGRFSAAVTGTGTNAVMALYDTDGVPAAGSTTTALGTGAMQPMAVIRNVSANEFIPGHDVFEVNYGLYVVMTGTAVQGFISMDRKYVVEDTPSYVNYGLKAGGPRP